MTYSDKQKLHKQLQSAVDIWSLWGPLDRAMESKQKLETVENINRKINYLAMWAGTDSMIELLEKQLAELQ